MDIRTLKDLDGLEIFGGLISKNPLGNDGIAFEVNHSFTVVITEQQCGCEIYPLIAHCGLECLFEVSSAFYKGNVIIKYEENNDNLDDVYNPSCSMLLFIDKASGEIAAKVGIDYNENDGSFFVCEFDELMK